MAITVEGHTDSDGVPIENLILSRLRANAVRDYLISLGVPARLLVVTSYGESKPFVRGSNEQSWAMNRRAHFERP